MARPTKSTKELKAVGTFRPDRQGTRLENHVTPVDDLPCPPHYDKEHRAKWGEVVGHLKQFGILQKQDFDAIRAYVETEILQRRCWEQMYKDGAPQMVISVETRAGTIQKVNPAYTAYLNADRILKPLREKFAFTPKDRQSVHVSGKTEKPADPFNSVIPGVAPSEL